MTDIGSAWGRLEQRVAAGDYRHYRPLSDAVDTFVAEAQDGERIYFGIPEFDQQIRGVGRSHLCMVNGYSHSGKTLWLAHVLRHNKDKRTAFFIPDEPAQLVLAKLASAEHGVSADWIEDQVAKGDQAAIQLLRDTALLSFPNLVVFDKPLTAEGMEAALAEAEAVWGDKCQLVIVDYLDLLSAGETVQQKGAFVKAFGARHEVPVICLHQSSRTAGTGGKAQDISSGSYGGEQLATFQLGVWRKQAAIVQELTEVKDKQLRGQGDADKLAARREELEHELERHKFTVTVAITKNKRPGRREGREEIDFELFGDTGIIVPLEPSELPAQYRALLARKRQTAPPVVAEYPADPVEDWVEPEMFAPPPNEEPF